MRRHPEISAAVIMANSDSLIGPVRVPEGLSVFAVIGIRVAESRNPVSVSEVSRGIGETYRARTVEALLNRHLSDLATQYGVELRYGNLTRVSIIPVQMFTRRSMGFKGVMTAYPMMYRLDGWTNQWNEKNSVVP